MNGRCLALYGWTLLLIGLLIAGCGGGDSEVAVGNGTIEGVASKGIIDGGTVTAYAVNEDGTKGRELGSVPTDANGKYSIVIDDSNGVYDGPIIVEVTGGSYTDEATGVTVGNDKLRAIVPPIKGTKKVAVTPLTEIAVQIAGSTYNVTRINNANAAVSVLLGGADIVETQPQDIDGDLSGSTDAEKDYTIILAVISQMIEDGIAIDVTDAAAQISADLADDGALTVEMGILANPAGLGDLLQVALDNFIASDDNNTGLGEDDVTIDEALHDALAEPYFFSADNGTDGIELWVTDGTEAGTKMLKDINPGAGNSYPQDLQVINGMLVFTADDGTHGWEPWVSDGTEAGTFMLKDIWPGTGSAYAWDKVVLAGKLYFRADDGTHGWNLWASDGTEAGTYMVKDINPDVAGSSLPAYMTEMNGKIYFNVDDGTHGAELWVTDGTEAGTYMVKDIYPDASSSFPMQFSVMDNKLYFSAKHRTNDNELWVTDGTEAGTYMVKDISPGANSSSPADMTLYKGKLYFEADDGTTGFELWVTDGTEAGTYMVKDVRAGFNDGISRSWSHFTEMGGKLYFKGIDDAWQPTLWVTDGTEAGTHLVSEINADPAVPLNLRSTFAVTNNKFYFRGNDGINGYELWTSDGTTEGTYMVKDIVEGSDHSWPWDIVNKGGKLYFSTLNLPDSGGELWISDGTEAGTYMVKDINPGVDQGYLGTEDF